MDNDVSINENKTQENRLKIKQIRKLKSKNKILSLLRVTGIVACLNVYLLGFLSIFGKNFGIESKNNIVLVIMFLIKAHYDKKSFVYGIPKNMQENNELIVKLQNEISDDEIERDK